MDRLSGAVVLAAAAFVACLLGQNLPNTTRCRDVADCVAADGIRSECWGGGVCLWLLCLATYQSEQPQLTRVT